MDIYSELSKLAQKAFDDDSISLDAATTANDVDGWDSLSHTNLVTMIERHFQIRFTSLEILKWKNVGQMAESIQNRLNEKKG
jgi:acyl carrier protein